MGAILVRFGLYIALMALFGLASFGLYALRGGERRFDATLPFTPLLAGTALVAALCSALGLALAAAAMDGVAITALDRSTFDAVLWETALGTAWQVRMAALALAILLALVGARRPRLALAGIAAAGAIAIVTLAWGGHGAMNEGAPGWTQLIADIAHLLAAGIWIGALFGLVLLLWRPVLHMDRTHLTLSHRVLAGFSAIGTAVVGIILVSGLINAWMLVGVTNILTLPASRYGLLLIVKLVVFGAMIALAAANRFRLTPAFERAILDGDHAVAIRALRRSLGIEAGCAITVIALVAWLGTLEPPVSAMM